MIQDSFELLSFQTASLWAKYRRILILNVLRATKKQGMARKKKGKEDVESS